MTLKQVTEYPAIPSLKMSVVGHVEWVTFLKVNKLPKQGEIIKSEKYFEGPAGGGAVAAVKMKMITNQEVSQDK